MVIFLVVEKKTAALFFTRENLHRKKNNLDLIKKIIVYNITQE